MTDDNYIVIQGWMINRLELSGNDLLCYALVYGFSQDGDSEFKGSLKYVANSLNVSKDNARIILKRLVDKGLIIKTDEIINGVKFCKYSYNSGGIAETAIGELKQLRGSCSGVYMKQRRGIAETATGGIAETATNNTIIDKDIDNNREKEIKEKGTRKKDEPFFTPSPGFIDPDKALKILNSNLSKYAPRILAMKYPLSKEDLAEILTKYSPADLISAIIHWRDTKKVEKFSSAKNLIEKRLTASATESPAPGIPLSFETEVKRLAR